MLWGIGPSRYVRRIGCLHGDRSAVRVSTRIIVDLTAAAILVSVDVGSTADCAAGSTLAY